MQHSLIFDMESFLWVLVYAILFQAKSGPGLEEKDGKLWQYLVPSVYREYDSDIAFKGLFIYEASDASDPIYNGSRLEPHKDTIVALSKLVEAKNKAARRHSNANFQTWFTHTEEDEYVDEFIRIFERAMVKV